MQRELLLGVICTNLSGKEKRSNERQEQQVSYIKHRCNENTPIQQQTMDDSDSYVSDSDSEFSPMQQKRNITVQLCHYKYLHSQIEQ